jgi:hypothetical protein
MVQADPGIKQDPISKITNIWAGGIVQVVEHQPSKHEALSSSPPSTGGKRTKNNQHKWS